MIYTITKKKRLYVSKILLKKKHFWKVIKTKIKCKILKSIALKS